MRFKNSDFQNQDNENRVVDPRKRVQLKPNEKSVQSTKDPLVLGRAGKITKRNKDWYNV